MDPSFVESRTIIMFVQIFKINMHIKNNFKSQYMLMYKTIVLQNIYLSNKKNVYMYLKKNLCYLNFKSYIRIVFSVFTISDNVD